MDIKTALQAALPQETRLCALAIEFAEHLEELGALWFRINHSWMVTGRYRINRKTHQPHQWHENFWMEGEDANFVRKTLNRFLETNRMDVLSEVYDDQAQPSVDRVTPVLAKLQVEIYKTLKYDGSYNSVEAVAFWESSKLPRRWKSNPMELRCATLFLKRYHADVGTEERKAVLKRVVGRSRTTDTVTANTLRKIYKALGGNVADLEFWDEYLSKSHAECQQRHEAWKNEQGS